MGSFLQYFFVNVFTPFSVFAFLISLGSLFQIFAALMQKLFSPISVLALSFKSLNFWCECSRRLHSRQVCIATCHYDLSKCDLIMDPGWGLKPGASRFIATRRAIRAIVLWCCTNNILPGFATGLDQDWACL